MPPLISLETSALKHDALPRAPHEGKTVELELIGAMRKDDSNVIQFSGPGTFDMETAEDEADGVEEGARSDPKLARYRQLFENSPAAIVLLDTYDHVVDLNPAFTKIFQYSLEDIKNFPLTNFIVPKGRMREAIDITLRTLRGESILETLQRKRKDGSLVRVELTAFPVKLSASRIGIFTIYTDVSHKSAADRRRAECEKFEILGQLAQGTARGVNAVLGVLMAGTKQMTHAASQGASTQKTLFEMNAALDRGVELVGRLLDFAGKADVHPDMANADARLYELAALLQALADGAPLPSSGGCSAYAAP